MQQIQSLCRPPAPARLDLARHCCALACLHLDDPPPASHLQHLLEMPYPRRARALNSLPPPSAVLCTHACLQDSKHAAARVQTRSRHLARRSTTLAAKGQASEHKPPTATHLRPLGAARLFRYPFAVAVQLRPRSWRMEKDRKTEREGVWRARQKKGGKK